MRTHFSVTQLSTFNVYVLHRLTVAVLEWNTFYKAFCMENITSIVTSIKNMK